MVRERWLPVVEHPEAYEVSDHGRVRSVDRHVLIQFARRAPVWRFHRGRMLKVDQHPSGHCTVSIGKKCVRYVHILVMAAFAGPCPEGHEVLHLNHKPWNNCRSNLRYGTQSENLKMDYAVSKRHGWTYVNATGGRWHRG